MNNTYSVSGVAGWKCVAVGSEMCHCYVENNKSYNATALTATQTQMQYSVWPLEGSWWWADEWCGYCCSRPSSLFHIAACASFPARPGKYLYKNLRLAVNISVLFLQQAVPFFFFLIMVTKPPEILTLTRPLAKTLGGKREWYFFTAWRLPSKTTKTVNPLPEVFNICNSASNRMNRTVSEYLLKRVNLMKWRWTTMMAVKSVKVLAGSIFSAKYLLWYSWQSQVSMQPSVPAPPPSAGDTVTDFIRPYYCFHIAAVTILTVKLKCRIRPFGF